MGTNVSLLGDYNYHANAEANVYCKTFFSFERFGLRNPVETKTHTKGNILNLVVTREIEFLPMDITTDTIVTSDYVAVVFGIRAPKPLSENKSTKYRRWKLLNLDSFKADLSVSYIH